MGDHVDTSPAASDRSSRSTITVNGSSVALSAIAGAGAAVAGPKPRTKKKPRLARLGETFAQG